MNDIQIGDVVIRERGTPDERCAVVTGMNETYVYLRNICYFRRNSYLETGSWYIHEFQLANNKEVNTYEQLANQ